MAKCSILIVDDDSGVVDWLVESFRDEGYRVRGVTSVKAALALVTEHDIDLVITDVEMPEQRGIDFLRSIHEVNPEQLVVLITAFGSIDLAMEAVRAGAVDFLAKPFRIEALFLAVERAFRERQMRREIVRLRSAVSGYVPEGLIAFSPAMQRAVDVATRSANSDLPVLLTGESGVGKGALAHFIHKQSARCDHPFVQVNCAALPPTLAEAELFGVRRGAFTDARADRPGIFEQAHNGVLFLDEMGELPLELQAKLLQTLEAGRVKPVGAAKEVAVNVRIIAATNRNLEDELRTKRFRLDLYHRINVIDIHVPPLRERPEDIEPLIDQVLHLIAQRTRNPPIGIAASAMRWLRSQNWPGNVRELRNAIERAVALAVHDTLTLEDFAGAAPQGITESVVDEASCAEWSLEQLERVYIRRVLEKTAGNKAQAARILGLDRRTLYRKASELDRQS